MFPDVYGVLSSASAVTALVSDKLFANVSPQKVEPPYVVWDMSSGFPQNYLGETPGIDHQVVDIRCYGRNSTQAEAVAKAVRDALDGVAQSTSSPITEWEFETKLYVVMLAFSFWTNRA